MCIISSAITFFFFFFFFNDTATTEIYTLSLHDALPISCQAAGTGRRKRHAPQARAAPARPVHAGHAGVHPGDGGALPHAHAQELAELPDPELQVLPRVGVREPEVALAVGAEGGAREAGDAGLLEQERRELAARDAGAGDVREHVERPVWREAAHARQRRQALDHQVAPRAELLDHRADLVLRSGERRLPGALDEGRGAG